MNKGRYYKFIYNHMKEIKHIGYSYDILNDIMIDYLYHYKNIKNVDKREVLFSLEWVMADLGLDENLCGE